MLSVNDALNDGPIAKSREMRTVGIFVVKCQPLSPLGGESPRNYGVKIKSMFHGTWGDQYC